MSSREKNLSECVRVGPWLINFNLLHLTPFMAPLIITIKENLQLQNVPPEIMATLVEKLEFINPKWLENDRMGRWNRGTPQVLKFYDKVGRNGL